MPGGLELPPFPVDPPKHQGGGGGGHGGGGTIPWDGSAYGYGTIQVPAAADKNNDGKISLDEINSYISANPDWATQAFGGGGGGGGGASGSSGGGSSPGGSSGGGVAADPDQPLISAGTSKYFQMWGEPPPSDLIKKLVKNENMNIWQMEDLWRHDPAWLKTEAAKNEADTLAGTLHQLGVA